MEYENKEKKKKRVWSPTKQIRHLPVNMIKCLYYIWPNIKEKIEPKLSANIWLNIKKNYFVQFPVKSCYFLLYQEMPVKMMERSLFSGRNVFLENMQLTWATNTLYFIYIDIFYFTTYHRSTLKLILLILTNTFNDQNMHCIIFYILNIFPRQQITPMEYSVLSEWYNFIMNQEDIKVDMFGNYILFYMTTVLTFQIARSL